MTLFNFFAGLSWGLSSSLLLWLLAVQLSAVVSEINDEPEFLMFLLWFFSSLLHFGHVIHCNLYNLEGLQSKFWTSVGNKHNEWMNLKVSSPNRLLLNLAQCDVHASNMHLTLSPWERAKEKNTFIFTRESSTYILPSTPSVIPPISGGKQENSALLRGVGLRGKTTNMNVYSIWS